MVRFDFGHPLFSFLETHQLRGLARAREVSCDRVGLLACQDLRVATTAMFKVASGLNANWVDFDEEAYAHQFDTLEDLDELVEADDSGGTHPPMPLRVKALVAFAHSELWARALGAGDWRLSAQELESAVDGMMARVDPDLSTLEGADAAHAANAFIRAAALLVVAADGVVSPEEVEWLNRNAGGGHTVESVERVLEDTTLAEQARGDVAACAEVLRLKLPEVQRAGLLRAMCEVAACAGGIVDAEMLVLNELRNALDVSMDVARDQLAEVRCGLGQVC
jgi:uncharacterized tellurite resistance protein B-like protein